MRATKLELTDFRNYTAQSVSFGEGINVFYGNNAQGKTNLLEGIFLFSMGKSNRTGRVSELIRNGAGEAKLNLSFRDGDRDMEAEIRLYRDRRKVISINGVPIQRSSELVGRFRVVYFGPEYLSLVKEGPAGRRRNLDIFISQIKPRYFSALSDVKKIIESKNALLKLERPNQTMLDILNDKLASGAAELIVQRAGYIAALSETAKEIQSHISGGTEELTMTYQSCIGAAEGLPLAEVQKRLRQKLEESKRRESELRESVIGPHREDILYAINGYDARAYASQGQQKTIVLVQKLSEVALMQKETGDLPVLLLDDIMSELDKTRRGFILNHIRDMQIFITCTDMDDLGANQTDIRLFPVQGGTVTEGE